MPNPRRRRGFESVGSLPLERLGLPKRRAREMLLARCWDEVAGEAVSARARVLRIVRGVLEIEVADGPWAETVGQMLPALAGRLAASRPELGVRSCRLLRTGALVREEPRAVEPSVEADRGTAPRHVAPAPSSRETTAGEGLDLERLSEIARRYLARSAR